MMNIRTFCSKVCPGGWLQDWAYKIPWPFKLKTFKGDGYLRYIKYILLVCEFIMLLMGQNTRSNLEVSTQTILIFAVTVLVFIIWQRPVCKYFCPAGALLSVGNKITRHKYRVDKDKCVECGVCEQSCLVDIIPYKQPNSLECLRCGKCLEVCPNQAITID